MPEIIYHQQMRNNKVHDSFSATLNEAADFFNSRGISMTNANGFSDILSEQSYFDAYKGFLTEGLQGQDAENFEQILENSRLNILQEATTSGIQNLAGLSMPTIRKMWAKVALKHAIPTQAVKAPRFAISYMKAYIMDANGVKKELPNAINDIDHDELNLPRIDKDYSITVPGTDVDLFSHIDTAAFPNYVHKPLDTLDKVFYIDTVTATGLTVTDSGTTVNCADQTIKVRIKSDLQSLLYGEVTIPLIDNTDPDNPVDYGTTTDRIMGKIDYETGMFTVMSIGGLVTACTVDAKITQETNEQGDSISFDILTKDITIGTGSHINAPLPIEWLQDTMATYNIDGAAEVIDIMSQTVAQKLEIEIYKFLRDSIEEYNVQYNSSFDMIPSAGYAGRPKEWREELKTIIDYYAIKMKSDAKFSNGKFVIIGNPIDMQIIPNVNWVFTHTNDEMAGVDVSFNLGAYSGANNYELVSSDLIPAGDLIMFFVPAVDRLMTYKYYPYTFNVERGYRDPNMPNVPSIMMTKRHSLSVFSPLISRITIKNNNGRVIATPGY